MDWVKNFYNKQYLYLPVNDSDYYNRKFLLLKRVLNGNLSDKKCLELGGGRGEFLLLAAKEHLRTSMVDISKKACAVARKKTKGYDHINVICTDFYEYLASNKSCFDIICYWDGFGIGSDEEQETLLRLINESLTSKGMAIIEIYSPYFWINFNNYVINISHNVKRKYNFNLYKSILLDNWSFPDNSQECQYLRCYSPVEIIKTTNEIGFKTKLLSVNGNELTHEALKNDFSYVIILNKLS